LVTATREIGNYNKYDYILINDDLEESIENLQAIVLAERLQRAGQPLSVNERKIVELADRHRLANVRDRIGPILDSFGNPPPPAHP
jgi:hypothetical protein